MNLLIENKKLLKEIHQIWADFAETIYLFEGVEQIISYRSELYRLNRRLKSFEKSVIKGDYNNLANHQDYDKYFKQPFLRTKKFLNDHNRENINLYNLIRSKADLKKFKKCITDFEKLIDHDKYKEFNDKFLKEKEQDLKEFIDWYKPEINKIKKLIDYLLYLSNKNKITNVTKELKKLGNIEMNIFPKIEIFHRMPDNIKETRTFVYELNAMIKIANSDILNYEIAKKICAKKKLNVFRKGLLMHDVTRSFWNPTQLKNLVKNGLIFPRKLDTNSMFQNHISFYLTEEKLKITDLDWSGIFTIILDPIFVKKNHNHFFYTLETQWGEHSEQYLQICEKNKFILQPTYSHELGNEIKSDTEIPFSAIIGVFIKNKKYTYRIIHFMHSLMLKKPELVFPIYNKKGKMIWPN